MNFHIFLFTKGRIFLQCFLSFLSAFNILINYHCYSIKQTGAWKRDTPYVFLLKLCMAKLQEKAKTAEIPSFCKGGWRVSSYSDILDRNLFHSCKRKISVVLLITYHSPSKYRIKFKLKLLSDTYIYISP